MLKQRAARTARSASDHKALTRQSYLSSLIPSRIATTAFTTIHPKKAKVKLTSCFQQFIVSWYSC